MGVTNVDKSDQHCHTEGKEENMCFLRIPGSELVVHLNPIYEIPFCRVNALAGTIMKHWGLPFSIDKDLELLFHFQVAPVADRQTIATPLVSRTRQD